MNEKREVILPSDFSGEKGKIVCYRISSYLELLYIDIRSRRSGHDSEFQFPWQV